MEPSEALLIGRRSLEGISQVEIIEDWKWDTSLKVWHLLLSIELSHESNIIATKSYWQLTAQGIYPRGEVNIYPATNGGICDTFFHQSNNGLIESNGLWRKGKLCLQHPLDEFSYSHKEIKTIEGRIRWNIERAIEWVENVNQNTLVSTEDWFELPQFKKEGILKIVFNEDAVSLMEWEDSGGNFGFVDIGTLKNNYLFTKCYRDIKGNVCMDSSWGKYSTEYANTDTYLGIWILLKNVPVINNWQAPNTLEELALVFKAEGMDLKEVFSSLFFRLRDGKKHLLLIGFPIPEKFGGEPHLIHWQACFLPRLSYGKKTAKGYRNNETGWLRRDFTQVFTDKMFIEWKRTENWNHSQISKRGRYANDVIRSKYIILGLGTLGAAIAELLVRGGTNNITLVDGDYLEAGNLSRHSLSFNELDKNKATAMAKYLNNISCHARVTAYESNFDVEMLKIIDNHDIIIDCTANNEVLQLLSTYNRKRAGIYFSVSIGYKAERLYLSYQKSKAFEYDEFFTAFNNYLIDENRNIKLEALPWEGIGCWSPVFPALYQDIMLASSTSITIMTKLIENKKEDSQYYVFNKKYDEEGILIGYGREK